MGRDTTMARRVQAIEPFHVMDILARAKHLERSGRKIVHMEIGEPDFVTAQPVIEAGIRALRAGKTFYTPALGLPELREAISLYYKQTYGADVPARRIVVTPGASGALQLALAALVDPGDGVLMSDPGYPCNRHLVHHINGNPIAIPVRAEDGFQLTGQAIRSHSAPATKLVMAASPSNPTGTILDEDRLRDLIDACAASGNCLVVDEIYHGLVYGSRLPTALSLAEDVFVVNSFSKFFGMTGWRVGWLVVPESFIRAIDKLAQNIFLAAPTIAQHAAIAALQPESLAIMEQRRDRFQERRDYLLEELKRLGYTIPVVPRGAFYIYANSQHISSDSLKFSQDLLESVGVAITPGCDFGTFQAQRHVRFAYTTRMEQLRLGIERLERYQVERYVV